MSSIAATRNTATDHGRAPGFMAALSSEWVKLTSVRSTYFIALLALVLGVGFTALSTIVIGATWDDWSVEDRASLDTTMTSFFGMLFTGILLIVLAVKAVTDEYSSGMMRLTLTATPRRGRVFLAKMVVVALATLVIGTVSSIAMYVTGRLILEASGVPTEGIGDPGVLRVLILVCLSAPAIPLIAAALAFLMRSTAGAITTVLGMLFAPLILGAVLGEWWQKNIIRYLPGSASDSLMVVDVEPGSTTYLEPWLGAIVLIAWVALFCLAAYASFSKRDA